ncbi:MAG TPA: ribonuclease H-like domain-containing protein [Bradyrhizobium sp.]|uniref:ribonuclease H-like domain-containing protein n=1 Tax=Bradyrhizobium sp. TaxID=376 RepID=UPI002BCAE446|nr:ribonuclease H-like domain-containing protein [Bradyrhizobium sp.]HXB77162.1 ribonuclease H-like domain-containing protein [Bradyrhizobium sp.]
MPSDIMVWDLETIPDLEGYARANDLIGKSPEEIRTAMGDDFPKLIYHSIICIGALVASRTANGYEVQVVGAPHIGQRTEKELIESFVNKIAQLSPQLVTFSGGAFDLPVLRYRAMVHEVFAPGMHNRAYFHRYTDDNVDLCDVLSSFGYGARVKLDELSRIMGLPGKPGGMDGSQVEAYFNAGRIQEISDYCKSDVVNTYRLWLRHELFRGRLDHKQFEASEQMIVSFSRTT